MKDSQIDAVCAESNSRAQETTTLTFQNGELTIYFDPEKPDGVVVSSRGKGSTNSANTLGLLTPADLKRLGNLCNLFAQRVERTIKASFKNR